MKQKRRCDLTKDDIGSVVKLGKNSDTSYVIVGIGIQLIGVVEVRPRNPSKEYWSRKSEDQVFFCTSEEVHGFLKSYPGWFNRLKFHYKKVTVHGTTE